MRLTKGATRAQAIEEVCAKLFAPAGLREVPTILEWWDEETSRVVVPLRGWKARKALGLP